MKLISQASDKPVTVGIVQEKIELVYLPLSLLHIMVFPAIPGVTVTLSCEV